MLKIGEKQITTEDFYEVLFSSQKVELDKKTLPKLNKNFNFLKDFSKDKVIYGLNTGFGPMAKQKINDDDQVKLQYNLIRSHSSGSGKPIEDLYVKSALLCRLISLTKGKSGINKEAPELLMQFINKNIFPVIPKHGGVGASGDLVQLSHLALSLIGEGNVSFEGKIKPTKEILKNQKLSPINIQTREGLALINGTSVMTGIGLVNLIRAKQLLNWSLVFSSMMNEIMDSYDDSFSKELNEAKNHQGQKEIAEKIRIILQDSKLIRKRTDSYKMTKEELEKDNVQEVYSLRCLPQILGPVLDTIKYTEQVLIDETNSVNDNPLIDDMEKFVFHGGNFHGDYISLEMDKLRLVITKLSMLSERQLNFLLNDKLNQKLPPFVNLGKLGLNLGVQGMQFTATSTTAENQTLSNSMYVHSIPNNNDNQDIVSMGTNSALLTKNVIENTFEILSIQSIAILQAIDFLGIEKKLSSHSKKAYSDLRNLVPKFIEDSPKYEEIRIVKEFLMSNSFK